jgi:hypothetical protein
MLKAPLPIFTSSTCGTRRCTWHITSFFRSTTAQEYFSEEIDRNAILSKQLPCGSGLLPAVAHNRPYGCSSQDVSDSDLCFQPTLRVDKNRENCVQLSFLDGLNEVYPARSSEVTNLNRSSNLSGCRTCSAVSTRKKRFASRRRAGGLDIWSHGAPRRRCGTANPARHLLGLCPAVALPAPGSGHWETKGVGPY